MVEKSCHPAAPAAHSHHAGHGSGGSLATSFQATLHCLTGCVIGEVAGLAIGVTLGLPAWQTIVLATTLAYASGMMLGLLPVMRNRGVGLLDALRIIWIGEVISIGVMELVMNLVDYQMGGMSAPSILSWMFWRGLLFAVPAGFLAAWPVNYWLLKRELKACH
ncbi:DUF4396 domain-containing protein [Sphingomonas sp.]|uniref:DUF4396 domain-containing protein n=1 Tax=Sphingomonas sp. TaxID=28214 RepID=UPI00286DEE45|nr:DUF4396 domain-containing protein [Sphingomonas sp.]